MEKIVTFRRFKVVAEEIKDTGYGKHIIKFYDTANGREQFVSSYYASTLVEHGPSAIQLDGGVKEWAVTDIEMAAVISWIIALQQ